MITRKPLNHALYMALIAGGLTMGGAALAQPQGLYSSEELEDAEVYSNESDSDSIGEVENLLLDENMQLHSLVIDTSNLLDLGARQYVIERGEFTVETSNGDNLDEIEYRVNVDMTEEEITQQPEYGNDWWNETKQATLQAWENTKETADSAWESTKAATSSALTSAGNALEDAGNETEQAAESAAEETGDELEQAGDQAERSTE